MKKIVILASIIAGAIFVACGNSPKEQQSSGEPQTKKELFSPEEIAYNDSIKDIPMEYRIFSEEIRSDYSEPDKIIKRTHISELVITPEGPTQEDAYLLAYDYFTGAVITAYMMDVDSNRAGTYKMFKVWYKVLNKDGKDITRLISFPEQKEKELEIWKKHIQIRDNKLIKIVDYKTLKQPIINKGEDMVWVSKDYDPTQEMDSY